MQAPKIDLKPVGTLIYDSFNYIVQIELIQDPTDPTARFLGYVVINKTTGILESEFRTMIGAIAHVRICEESLQNFLSINELDELLEPFVDPDDEVSH